MAYSLRKSYNAIEYNFCGDIMSCSEIVKKDKKDCCISSCELIAIASAVSIAIAKGMDSDQITLLSDVFGMISANLSTIGDNDC